MVLSRRDGAVERIEERGVKRAEREFADDVREIERCRKGVGVLVLVVEESMIGTLER